MFGAELKSCVCPYCGGVGMSRPPHPHAYGHLDYDRYRCRKRKKCGKTVDAVKYEAWWAKHPSNPKATLTKG